MFDHIKSVQAWTTMVCHMYYASYCKVMTIVVCVIQSKDTVVQCIMWRKLNKVMKKNGMEKPNFKGFIADNVQAN
jgi:hypothetical protein